MNKIYLVIIVVAILSAFFRSIGLFINIADNKKLDNFFNAIPVAILSAMVFPDVLNSIGSTKLDLIIVLIAILIVVITTLKKRSMTYIIFLVLIFILTAKEVMRIGNF